jgi:hypothetical protein
LVESIKTVDVTGLLTNESSYKVADVKLNVQAYRLYGRETSKGTGNSSDVEGQQENCEDEPTLSQATTITLPSKDLDGLWDSYAFACKQLERN